jgi:hypothetical protein
VINATSTPAMHVAIATLRKIRVRLTSSVRIASIGDDAVCECRDSEGVFDDDGRFVRICSCCVGS